MMTDSEKTHNDNQNDDYGLPDLAFNQPVDRGEGDMGNVRKPENEPFEKKSSINWFAVISIVLFLGAGVGYAVWYFILNKPNVSETEELTEEVSSEENDMITEVANTTQDEENTADVEATDEVTEVVEEDSYTDEAVDAGGEGEMLATAGEGTITTVSSRTGKAYIVISSFFDEDLAYDHAKILAAEGHQVSVLAPDGGKKFYRVAVADFASYGEGMTASDQYRMRFGDDIWVLKY